ncbi:MAG: aldo/keto reductase [Candidatus Cloacimonas sp. SDB]|nr:MAG: aldo/keto reductase [Candidatus Cloacimonas sp. SDB]
MQYRKLGRTGLQVSVLGFGAMRLPVLDNDTKKIDEKLAEKMILYAIDKGVNYIDTAYPYHGGESERFLGRLLKGGLREKVLLATKLPCWSINDSTDFDKYFTEQLEKLQTDYFDCYLLHALDKESWKKICDLGVLEWCEKKKAAGKIKFLGFSFHDQYSVFKQIVDAYDNWDFCQIQYNYMDTNYQAGKRGFEYASRKGLGVIIMEPLRGGQLAEDPPAEIADLWKNFSSARSYADGALQWLWNQPDVSIVLSGMSNMQHVKENIASAETAQPNILTSKELDLYKKVRREYIKRSPIRCTGCKYCEPCPQKVAISSILGVFMMNAMYDDLKRSRTVYNKFIQADARADKCIECGECESKCPQNIKIIKWLKEAHQKFYVEDEV